MHGQIQDLLVFHQFYYSILLSFVVFILLPFHFSSFFSSYFLYLPVFHLGVLLDNDCICAHDPSIIRINYTSDTDSIRQSTDRPPIFHRYSTVDVSAECRPLYQPSYRWSIGRHIGRHTGRFVGRHIDRCSTDISRPTYRSRVHKLHMIHSALLQ